MELARAPRQASATAGAGGASACPRCQAPLVDPSGLGWCKSCGYCRTLQEESKMAEAPPPPRPAAMTGGVGDVVRLAGGMPSWAWLLLLGVVLLTVASFFLGRYLRPFVFERAVWCTVQLAAGLFLLLGAQFWAVVLLAHKDETIGLKDALLPSKLWVLIVRNLPTTRWQVWLSGWGVTLMISAVVFIGGMSHWLTYLPGQKPPPNAAKNKTK